MSEKKYPCTSCKGEGEIYVHSVPNDYKRSCEDCGGSGKQRITIGMDEYCKLKQDQKRVGELFDGRRGFVAMDRTSDDEEQWYLIHSREELDAAMEAMK